MFFHIFYLMCKFGYCNILIWINQGITIKYPANEIHIVNFLKNDTYRINILNVTFRVFYMLYCTLGMCQILFCRIPDSTGE